MPGPVILTKMPKQDNDMEGDDADYGQEGTDRMWRRIIPTSP